jgi:hypothetical protein
MNIDREALELINGVRLYIELYEKINGGKEKEFEKWCHLASAAIRLSTIHEKRNDKIKNDQLVDLFKKDVKDIKDELNADLSKYAYILLRDNICHLENCKNEYYKKRPLIIKEIGIDKMFLAIKEDFSRIK